MKFALSLSISVGLIAGPLFAQEVDRYMQAAIDSGVCGDARVEAAVYIAESNTIEVTCEEDPTAFVPLAGALGPLLAGGAAIVLAAAGGGGGPSDTQ